MPFDPLLARTSTAVLSMLGVAAVSPGAHAAPASAPEEIVVTATRVPEASFDLPASISSLDTAAIRDQQLQVNLSEALAAVPGLVVQNRENYAQDLQISSRGFGARATFGVRGMRVYVDGIPATMPDGQSQTSHIDLASAGRIEVLRGPFSALYGNSAGGVIAVFTEDGAPGSALSGNVEGGSHGFLRTAAKLSGDDAGFNYVLSAARFQTDGVRVHSAASRTDLNGKIRYTLDDSSQITVVGNGVDLPEAQDALGLTRAQVASDRTQAGTNALLFNSRKSVNQGQGGLIYDGHFGEGDDMKAVVYGGRRNTVQYQAIPVATQAPATSAGGVIDLSNGYWGGDAAWSHEASLDGTPLRITGGMTYGSLDSARRGYLNFIGSTLGVKGALRRDENDDVSNFDQFIQGELRPGPWLIQAGLRHSAIRFTSHDHYIVAGNGDDSGAKSYGGWLPVAGVTYQMTPAFNVYVSYGRGLQTPTSDELAYKSLDGSATGLNFGLRASHSDNYEGGIKARFGAVLLNASAFHIATTDEVVVQSNAGGRSVYQNVAATTRNGLELSAQGTWESGFGFKAAYTLLDATAAQPFLSCRGTPCVATTIPAGSRLPGIPRNSGYGELSWKHAPSGFSTALEVRAEDKVYVDDFNSDSAAGHGTADLRAGFTQSGAAWSVNEFVRVDNLLDQRYIGSVIVNESNGRFFEPAMGRAVYGGITARVKW